MEVPKPLIRNQAIVDAIPKGTKCILEVGAGNGRLSDYLRQFYKVGATDIRPEVEQVMWGDILNLETFPIQKADIVIASEVLEHIYDWQLALDNMVKIAQKKVIITVPYKDRVYAPDHIIYFDEEKVEQIRKKYKVKAQTIVHNKVYLLEIDK